MEAMSLILHEVNRVGEISRNQLVGTQLSIRTETIDQSLETLVDLNVLKKTSNLERCKYALRRSEEAGPKDFLILESWKRVAMSKEGSRGVRLRSKLMAVRDGVSGRPCGSMIWSDKVSAPKYRLGPARRINPLNGKDSVSLDFEIAKKENNDLAFRLNFSPPLSAGEMVDYGFYIWTSKVYAMSRKEALERYRDEWTREGVSVNDPSLSLKIQVKLPGEFRYDEARVEKNPVLTRDGPNVPGAMVSTFEKGQKMLTFEQEKPTTGHWFICWKPPANYV